MGLARWLLIVAFIVLAAKGLLIFVTSFGAIGLLALALVCFVVMTFVWIYRYEVGNANTTK